MSQQTLREVQEEKDKTIRGLQQQVQQQQRKMEDMSTEFSDMSKETMEKMSQRIELTSQQWDTHAPSSLVRRLEEFSLAHVDI